jgi:hypothetical protein
MAFLFVLSVCARAHRGFPQVAGSCAANVLKLGVCQGSGKRHACDEEAGTGASSEGRPMKLMKAF